MNHARLERLAEHLESVPTRGFDMKEWVTEDHIFYSGDDAARRLKRADKHNYKCGMAACVGGHAAIVFPRSLTIEHGRVALIRDTYVTGFEAIGALLGLCEDHVEQLCKANATHTTPKAAAKFIRKLISSSHKCCRG